MKHHAEVELLLRKVTKDIDPFVGLPSCFYIELHHNDDCSSIEFYAANTDEGLSAIYSAVSPGFDKRLNDFILRELL